MSSCSKISYPTRTAAGLALRAIARKCADPGRKVPRGAYVCASCRSWHLTSRTNVQTPSWAESSAEKPVQPELRSAGEV